MEMYKNKEEQIMAINGTHLTYTGPRDFHGKYVNPFNDQKPPTISIYKESKFDAAHNLDRYIGKCANLHGHTYVYRVYAKGKIDPETGLFIDFGDLKKVMKENVDDVLDHKYLNEVLPFITTGENLAIWIFNVLKYFIPEVSEVHLWETPTSCAIIKAEDFK